MADAGDYGGLARHVGRVLRWVWDPIDLGMCGPADEYDAYVPQFLALTRNAAVFENEFVARLAWIESEAMGLSLSPSKRTRAARALLGLREASLKGFGKLVQQWSSLDGLRCAQVFETPGGLYAYEERVLRHEDDENGQWSFWVDAGLRRSGLFDTAEAAEQEAHVVIGWLRNTDLAAAKSTAVPWGETVVWRTLEPQERAVLMRLLGTDFAGRDGLAAQVQTAIVRRIDDEGSLRFQVGAAPASVVARIPVEGRYLESDGATGPGINLLLHVVGGRLHELEIFKDDGDQIRIGPFEVSLEQIKVSVN